MKNINSNIIPSIVLITLILFFNACKKEDTNPSVTKGSLLFHLHTFVDTTEVENYGDTMLLNDGRQIVVSTAQLYISNIKLIKLDGTVIDGPATIVYFKQGIEEYEIGDVPSGNYKSVRFDVGLSDTTNAKTPASSDPILYQPTMWFESIVQPAGFVFINFQGTIDTSGAAKGTNLIPFTYKIGTTANRVTITMPDQNYTVTPNQQTVRHILANYSKLFEGVQLNNNSNLIISTVAQNTGPLASKIVSNIANMFRYEE